MFEAFLANTSTQGLSPLGTAPQRSYELISGTVRDSLGERHAALFAEPVATQYGDRFDWYASVAGKPRLLDSFEEDEQALVRADLDKLIGEISELGQSMLEHASPDQQRLGEALVNAVRYPSLDCVYVLVDGDDRQPVLLNWAWVSDTRTAVAGDLSGTGGAARSTKPTAAGTQAAVTAGAAGAASAPTAAVRHERGPLNLWWLMWFGWLLLLLLLAAILYLMIETCALRLPGVPSYCPGPGEVVSGESRRTLLLRDQIATVERQIGIADRACQPKPKASPIPALPPAVPGADRPVVPDADQSRLNERGAKEGKLTISLLWDSKADLHLDVRCPGNAIINFDNRTACGGNLDIGGNHNLNTAVPNAIESMYFDVPAAGPYAITVSLFDPQGQSPTQPFRLRIRDGEKTETFQGTVLQGQAPWTKTYIVGKAN